MVRTTQMRTRPRPIPIARPAPSCSHPMGSHVLGRPYTNSAPRERQRSPGVEALGACPEPVGGQPGAALPELEPGLDILQPPHRPDPGAPFGTVNERQQ